MSAYRIGLKTQPEPGLTRWLYFTGLWSMPWTAKSELSQVYVSMHQALTALSRAQSCGFGTGAQVVEVEPAARTKEG